jgi:uncharacterized repeat protein (TIGR01451 family)
MVKFYLFILIGLFNFSEAAKAQDVSLPLGPFRDFLVSRYPSCFVNQDINGNLMLNTSCTAITTEDSLVFHNMVPVFPFYDPVDLDGIQYFSSLKYLDCSNSQIMNFPAFPASLEYLNCSGSLADSPFGQLPGLPASLRKLICRNNYASSFGSALPDSLRYLDFSNNCFFGTFPLAFPSNLDTLICTDQWGVSPYQHIMTGLPSLPSSLLYLNCSSNALNSLPGLPVGLRYLNCSTNSVTNINGYTTYTLNSLPSLPDSLRYLFCNHLGLTSLPSLPSRLLYLDCSNSYAVNPDSTLVGTGISSLPPLPEGLLHLDCSMGAVHCIPRIPASLIYLGLDRDKVSCLPNSGNYSLSPGSGQPLPLCNITNNVYGCAAFPIASGRFFYDLNSNGIKDPGENYRSNVKVQGSNGWTTYSNSDGFYELSADLGNFSTTYTAPPFYAAVPPSATFTFSNYNSIAYDQVALQPTMSADSVMIAITPMNTARPGFQLVYDVFYENVGTTTVSPDIVFQFDDSRLSFNSASDPSVIQTGNSLGLTESGFSPGQSKRFTATFTVGASVPLGDSIRASASATANSVLALTNAASVVRGSFDPNDKDATPYLTLQQVNDGQYINYLIRFQNTGTDTAFKVIVTDTLSNYLDISSFQIISISHLCKISQEDNKLGFEFGNIKLPAKDVNEPKSHGFIKFRIKPIPTVPASTIIPNTSSIYFDYNIPVLTNTANTNIVSLIPLTLLSFQASGNPADKSALLYWKTSGEFNTRSFEIQRSSDGSGFERIGLVNAYGTGDHAYDFKTTMRSSLEYFRLKISDVDGRFTYSPVVKVRIPDMYESFTVLNNPVKGRMGIEVYDRALVNSTATITDNLGQVVYRFLLSNGIQFVEVGKLSPGIYYLVTTKGTKKVAFY